MLHRYDLVLARRAALIASALLVATVAVVAMTDDAARGASTLVARVASLAPIAAGIAAAITAAQARARGESLALRALGVSPGAVGRGAAIGAVSLGLAAALAAASRAVDLLPLFPRIAEGPSWIVRGADLVDPSRGVLVGPSGGIEVVSLATAGARSGFAPPRLPTVIALALAAVAVPVWSVAPGSAARRAIVAIAVALGSVGAFHLVAAGRAPAVALAAAPALLLVDAWLSYRREA